MFDSARQWIDRIRTKVIPEPAPKDEAKSDSRKFAEAFLDFSDFFEKISKDLTENSNLQKFNHLGESFRKAGYRAGQWGLKADIDSSAEMHIHITKNQIEEKCASNQRTLESEVEILKEIKNNAERDYKSKNSYYERLNRAYQYNQRQFSPLLGVIYGFFSIALVIADIPLALELTRRGFNLTTDPNNPISNLFQYGSNEGFLLNFFKVLAANWEVVLFAVGIAFCTVYIKIYYDDFIGVPLENLIKKSSESPRESYEELQEEDYQSDNEEPVDKRNTVKKRFDRLWWARFIIKTTVLLILLSAILILGYFRYSVVSSPRIQDINPSTIFLTYSGLTLLFPIISGICGSLSLNCFHNWRERGKAEKKSSNAQKKLLAATDKFQVKEAEKERNKGFIAWLDKPETVLQLKEYLISCYRFGFRYGYLHPEWIFGGDLYTRAEALRQRNLINPVEFPPPGSIEENQDIIN